MKLTIGIVNYNCIKDTLNLLQSINENPPSYPYEVIILDNASKDNSFKILRKIKNIKVIFKTKNLGFGRGCNEIGMRSDSEYLLFLNPDVTVTKNAIDILIEFMDKVKDCGVSGGKLLNPDGSIQYSCRRFPTFFNVFFGRENLMTRFWPDNRFSKKYMYVDMDYNKSNEVDWLRGAVFMVRKDLFKMINGFDERFFLYLEDTDFCRRVKKIGYKVFYLNNAIFFHKLSGCISSSLRNKLEHTYSFYKYFRKYSSSIFFNIILWVGFVLRISFIVFVENIKRIKR